MANARWSRFREQRDKLSADALPSKIVSRIVVIVNERDVKEFCLFNFDSGRYVQKIARAAIRFAMRGMAPTTPLPCQ